MAQSKIMVYCFVKPISNNKIGTVRNSALKVCYIYATGIV